MINDSKACFLVTLRPEGPNFFQVSVWSFETLLGHQWWTWITTLNSLENFVELCNFFLMVSQLIYILQYYHQHGHSSISLDSLCPKSDQHQFSPNKYSYLIKRKGYETLIDISPAEGKCFDLLSNSLNLFCKENCKICAVQKSLNWCFSSAAFFRVPDHIPLKSSLN